MSTMSTSTDVRFCSHWIEPIVADIAHNIPQGESWPKKEFENLKHAQQEITQTWYQAWQSGELSRGDIEELLEILKKAVESPEALDVVIGASADLLIQETVRGYLVLCDHYTDQNNKDAYMKHLVADLTILVAGTGCSRLTF